ncbi:MAG: hypothetical protein HY741_13105 [Chloroflexi bacterium]|nr:hypothetical protein [Chloroflexota bacterium]
MLILLTLLSALTIVIFFAVVLIYVRQITLVLESIGGKGDSYLAKLRLGLRAIEGETDHLAPEVTKLNDTLTRIAGGLKAVDEHLVHTIDAAVKQEDYSK